jgi:hypothetical protein
MTRANFLAFIVIAAELGSAWVSGMCTNKLFLFFLATGAVTLIVAVPRPTVVSAAVPIIVALALAGRVWHKPVVTHSSFSKGLVEIPTERGFRYAFDLEPLREWSERCQPSNAKLIILGKNLKHARIDVNGIEQIHTRIEALYWLDRLVLELPPTLTQFTATVTQDVRSSAAIYLGPQFRENDLYPEAIFVTSDNSQCRLVLHSRRSCKDKCPEILQSMSFELLKPN